MVRRRLFSLLAIVAVLAGAAGGSAQDATTLRILAYNIKHGEGMDDVVDLERAARVIRELEADIVALQEIDSAVERTSRVDQASVLGRLTGMHSAFGGFFDYQGGRYGMALLSKRPFEEVVNHRLPDGAEPRTALAARIRVGEPPQEMVVVGIHLYATAEERYAQAARLVELLAEESAPLILAGDFNSRPGSDVIALLASSWQIPKKGADHLTFPADAPDRQIDYIMYRPRERFEVASLRVIDEPLVSDHRPVLIELRLLDAGKRN
ncbi:MAG: endonuclease/exonuclease/phosphatase family protein [Gemmatimonadota bacterium]|nr:MAG: endonuclease/exonuclease/phosphatase family protein [Gemmatimonadota bacterium]